MLAAVKKSGGGGDGAAAKKPQIPLQLLSSQGKTQFWIPLHTREVLMHMLLWQKNVLPTQGAATQKA